jgi:hypothetical protein
LTVASRGPRTNQRRTAAAREEADALRALMRSAGLEELQLLGWLRSNGTRHELAFSGAWEVRLVADAGTLVVFRVGALAAGGIGTLTERIECAAAFSRIAPPGVVFAMERAIASRDILEHVRADLQDHGE